MVPVEPDWLKVKEKKRKKDVTAPDDHNPTVDLYKAVEDINVYSRQKKGGWRGVSGPLVPESKYCIFCSNGGICLGSSCKGRGPTFETKLSMEPQVTNNPGVKKVLPGLNFKNVQSKHSYR